MDDKKVIVILDSESKNVIKSSISAMGLAGLIFIDDLNMLTDDLLNKSKDIVILEGFMQRTSCLSELRLYQKLYDLTYYYLGSRKYFEVLGTMATCYECDLAALDYSTVMAAVYRDDSYEVMESRDYFDKTKIAEEILKSETDYDYSAVEVAKAYLNTKDIFGQITKQHNDIQNRLKLLENENARLRQDRQILLDGFQNIIKESEELNRNLQRYEEIFTQDIYEKLRLSDYVNKPFVMYFKEFEDFLNLNEFIETIVSVLRLQDRKSVKVLRLFDSHTSRKLYTVPDYYTILRNRYSMESVMKADFLCKSGDYKYVLDKLLYNEIGLDILIIVDSLSYDDIVVSGTSLSMNLCREVEHVGTFRLNPENTIVNTGNIESDVYWEPIAVKDMEKNDKMIFLSSRLVIRKILELYRYFNQSV